MKYISLCSRTVAFFVMIGFLGGSFEATARQVPEEMAVLQPSDSHGADWFGYVTAMDGRRAVVSALRNDKGFEHAGSAYVFEQDLSGNWIEVAQLQASDNAFYLMFGTSVSLEGDRLLVGAGFEDRGENSGPMKNAGAAYVFDRNAATGLWEETFKMTASDASTQDHFGDSVALRGDVAVVGADFKTGTVGQGAAYVFERQDDGTWLEMNKIVPSDLTGYDWFGYPLALEDQRLIIGASNSNNGDGAVYVYERDSGTGWTQVAKLTNPDPAGLNWFGMSIALQGNTVLIGAPEGPPRDGVVYVFERNSSGEWPLVQTLYASDRQAEIGFGFSVAMSGDLAAIGTNMDDRSAQLNGVVYLFQRNPETGEWSEKARFEASDHDGTLVDQFGWSVALDQDCLVASSLYLDTTGGVSPGTAYVYDLSAFITATDADVLPSEFRLEQNYPNPFNPNTMIGYTLEQAGSVDLTVFDIRGRAVRTIDSGFRLPGRHEVSFDARILPTGVYAYRLTVDGRSSSKRMLLVR